MSADSYYFPLSFAQQRLWFLDRIAPGNPFYNIPLAIPIPAILNVKALESALNAIVARHESLRTTFRVIDNEPSQVVHPSLELQLPVINLQALSPAERDRRSLELATEDAQKPFDLERGPLVRATLITRGWSDHILLLSMHHIISDGWSIGILVQELTALYQSFSLGLPNRLPELPIQYADFAVWQRESLQGELLGDHLKYWRTQLSDLPLLDLPLDRPRPPVLTYRGSFHPVKLSAVISAGIRRFAQAHNATPFMVLFAAFAALLQRYSAQDDLAIGIPVANRNRDEVESLIGFFVNSLVLRVDLSGAPTFSELVGRVREVAISAYAHQDLPFEKLVEELHLPRDLSRNPLFQVTFQLVNTPTLQKRVTSNGHHGEIQVQRGSAIFDLAFTLMDTAASYSGIFEYSTDLFDAATIARIERHYVQLLQGALGTPDQGLNLLRLTNAEEESELLRLSQGPDATISQPFVHELIAAQARQTPHSIAVKSNNAELTYDQLLRRARKLASDLRIHGVGVESRVGILMDRSPEMVVALLAVLQAGGVYVPLDPTYPVDRLRFMVDDSRALVLLTNAPQLQLAESISRESIKLICLDGDSNAMSSTTEFSGAVELHPENLAYVLYTSGSTGRPKGVAIPHRALGNHMLWMQNEFPLNEHDRVLQRTPYSFDASVWEFFAPLMAGSQLVILPPEAQKDPQQIVKCMAEFGVTVVQFVPSLLRVVLDEPAFYGCTSLRRLFCGGEALPEEIRERIKSSVGVELVNLYGPTEATIDTTFYTASDRSEPFGVPIGRPIANVQAYVLDDNLNHVPIGVAGELYAGGAALARGYIDKPDLTAERFLPDPYSKEPGGRIYRTGDRVRRLADGTLLFLSRVDQLLKVRGYRIEPAEIESVIREVDVVRDCAVVAEKSRGEASGLVAYVVAGDEENQAASTTEIRDAQKDHVSRWQQIYEETYGSLPSYKDPAPDFIGWNSSYSGSAIDSEEMLNWRASTLDRIKNLRPTRVLEIGCGTGLLLSELAPVCEHYVGTDFSPTVLNYLRSSLAHLNGDGHHIELKHQVAGDFTGLADGSFDTIVLNSVIQYFPDIEYLLSVLKEAVKVLKPGGSIFVGDVRSLQLLDAFQLSVALQKANDEVDPVALYRQIRAASEQEEELVVDPRFFYLLPNRIPGISSATVSLKRGFDRNELTRFRYDVVLGTKASVPASQCRGIDWADHYTSLEEFLIKTTSDQPDQLIIQNVPNARTRVEARLLEALAQDSGQTSLTELRQQAVDESAGALDPEEFWQAPELEPWNVQITFSRFQLIDSFDVLLTRKGLPAVEDPAQSECEGKEPVAWSRYANNPLRSGVSRRLGTRIRESIANKLPDYMIPSNFVALDELPLMPNGKLNRAALPETLGFRRDDVGYVPPRTPVEQVLAMIWAEVLNLQRVGIRDDFFTELGGHSLLATRLISRVREVFGSAIPLKQVFVTPNIERFAAALLDCDPEEREEIETAATVLLKLSEMSEAELDAALSEHEQIRM